MRIVSATEVDDALTFDGLVEVLRQAFREGAVQPVRHHHHIEQPGRASPTLLLMPAWSDFSTSDSGFVGVKIVTVAPDNNQIGKPAVMGQYLLLEGHTGEPLALIDGQRLTQWRTACASALAASYLARQDSERLLMVGAGAMSGFLARAHAAVRPIKTIAVWNRSAAGAERLAAELREAGFDARAVSDLDAELAQADIISCATISTTPLVKGAVLRPGTHVDLVGAFTPAMRESDDAAIERASVFVDTREGALQEAGDIVQAIASGALQPDAIQADLPELCAGAHAGRSDNNQITLFKSVGAAIEDLAAGVAVYRSISSKA